MVPKELDCVNESPTVSEAENLSLDEVRINNNGTIETENDINNIIVAFGHITESDWDLIENVNDDEDLRTEETEEHEPTNIKYNFDKTLKPEEVGKQIREALSRWIEIEMQLSTITKFEAATTATMNFVFFNDEQCQKYRKMIQAVQEALEQLSSGIRSKIDNHVCFYGKHHKSLLERHLKTESKNAIDDLDNFFDPENYQDETTEMGRQLTEQGIARVIKLYHQENDDVVRYERKLASDSIAEMMQCFLEKLQSTLDINRNKLVLDSRLDSSLEEIQKRMKNSCLKSFNDAFDFEERVNDFHTSAGKILDTDMENEMQKIMQRQIEEKYFIAPALSNADVAQEGRINKEKVQIPQQGKNAQLMGEAIEEQQEQFPSEDSKKPKLSAKPWPMQKSNYVAAIQMDFHQKDEKNMQPLDAPELVRSLLFKNSSNHNSIQQVRETGNSAKALANHMVQKISKEEPESDFAKVYKKYVPRKQGMTPIAKKVQWPPQSKTLQHKEKGTDEQQREIPPTQKTEHSPTSRSMQKTNYVAATEIQNDANGKTLQPKHSSNHNLISQVQETWKSGEPPVHLVTISKQESFYASQLANKCMIEKADSAKAEKSQSDFANVYKSSATRLQGTKPIVKKFQWPPQIENQKPTEKATEEPQRESFPTQREEPSRKQQLPHKSNYVLTIQKQLQNIGTGIQAHNTPKRVQTPVFKNSSTHSWNQQTKESINSAKTAVKNADKKILHSEIRQISNDHLMGKADSRNQSKYPCIIQSAHDKAVISSQEQPPYGYLSQSNQFHQRQMQHVEITLKESKIQTLAVHKKNPQSNVIDQSITERQEPAIKKYLSTVFTNCKAKFSNSVASDNKQNAVIVSKPKDKVTQKRAAASPVTSNKTQSVKNESKHPVKRNFNNILEQKNSLKLKCNDIIVLIKNEKFEVGSDTLLQNWKDVVTHARDVASSSMTEKEILQQLDLLERTRKDLLKAVVGTRYSRKSRDDLLKHRV